VMGPPLWTLGDAGEAHGLLRRGATGLTQTGALPLAALALRDMADACPTGDAAQWAEAELARCGERLGPRLYRNIASDPSEELAAELGRLGLHRLRARTLPPAPPPD